MLHFRVSLGVWLVTFSGLLLAQKAEDAGRQVYNNNCSVCHGGDGFGGEHGPAIAWRLTKLEDQQIEELIHGGRPSRGMPAFPSISGEKLKDLLTFLRTLQSERPPALPHKAAETTSGVTLEGELLSESMQDMALRTSDQRIHLLRPAGDKYREVTSEVDWTSYNGTVGGNRYSTLDQIRTANVGRLVPRWWRASCM